MMVACMAIIYTALVVLLFRFKLLRPRPWPIAGCAVTGVVLLGAIVVVWKLCAPMSGQVITNQYVVQLVPYVKGQVLKIHAQPNVPLKKGDLLLEINPEPFQYTVNQVKAQLASAKYNVQQAKASVDKAMAGVDQAEAALKQAKAGVVAAQSADDKAKAQDKLAKIEEQIALNVQKQDPGAISDLKVAKAVQDRQAADAALQQAEAGVNESKAAQQQATAGVAGAHAAKQQSDFALQVAESNVIAVSSQLDSANFSLAQCKVYAPTDGYVVNWQVQEGTMLVSAPIAAAGTFVSTEETFIIASLPQNYLMNVQAGDDAEVILDPYPGQLFKAKVEYVITATGEGQYAPSGQIPDAAKVGSQGHFAVKIRLTGANAPSNLPLGAGGTVAIYTDAGKPVHVISKVVIRMKKWLLYVIPS